LKILFRVLAAGYYLVGAVVDWW